MNAASRYRQGSLLPLLLLGLTFLGCKDQPASNLPTVTMPIGNRTFTLEIAAQGAARQRGLMMRDSMPANHGMVFVFGEDQELSFWMHNTRIPLDILYIDRAGRIVSIKQMQPYVEAPVSSDGQARYAIELNQGTATQVGIRAGDYLKLPTAVTSTPADP